MFGNLFGAKNHDVENAQRELDQINREIEETRERTRKTLEEEERKQAEFDRTFNEVMNNLDDPDFISKIIKNP